MALFANGLRDASRIVSGSHRVATETIGGLEPPVDEYVSSALSYAESALDAAQYFSEEALTLFGLSDNLPFQSEVLASFQKLAQDSNDLRGSLIGGPFNPSTLIAATNEFWSTLTDIGQVFMRAQAEATNWSSGQYEFAENFIPLVRRNRQAAMNRLRSSIDAIEFRALKVDAQAIKQELEEVSGEKASLELWNFYEDLSTSELRSARLFRVMTIGLLMLISALTLVFAVKFADASLTQYAKKASVSLALIALATYLGREASKHRSVGRWAQLTAVQLKTARLFTNELSDDQAFRREVLAKIADRAFGHGPLERLSKESSSEG